MNIERVVSLVIPTIRQLYSRFSVGGRREEVGKDTSVESVAERNRASENQRPRWFPGVQPEQPAPERPESTKKRGRSVNRGREAWPQEKKTKKSCCCTADARCWTVGLVGIIRVS